MHSNAGSFDPRIQIIDKDIEDPWSNTEPLGTKCWVLHFDLNNPMQSYRLATECLESCRVEKNLEMLADSISTWESCVQAPRRPVASWLGSAIGASRTRRVTVPFVLRIGKATPWILCSSLQERHWGPVVVQRREIELVKVSEHKSAEEQLRKLVGLSLEKRMIRWNLITLYRCL